MTDFTKTQFIVQSEWGRHKRRGPVRIDGLLHCDEHLGIHRPQGPDGEKVWAVCHILTEMPVAKFKTLKAAKDFALEIAPIVASFDDAELALVTFITRVRSAAERWGGTPRFDLEAA